MTRQLRIDYEGAWHHIAARSTPERLMFEHDADRISYLSLLEIVSNRFDIEVHGYCLMSNHSHLIVRSTLGMLARSMQQFHSAFAQAWNRRRGTRGPVLDDRYLSKTVVTEPYLLELLRYLHRNPLEAGLVATAASLADYLWSSHAAYVGDVPTPPLLHTDVFLDSLGSPASARHRLRAFVCKTPAIGTLEEFFEAHQLSSLVGPVDERKAAAADLPEDFELAAAVRRTRPQPSLADIEVKVAEALGVKAASIFDGRSGHPNDARTLAVAIAFSMTTATHSELAAHYGYASPAGSASAVRRYRRALVSDREFSSLADVVLGQLGRRVA